MTEGSMRLPVRAPTLQEVIREVVHESRDHVSDLGKVIGTDGRYDHWDKLRYRKPPEGLTHREWWLYIKFLRKADSKPLPLLDKQGNPFTYGTPGSIPRNLHEIDMTSGGRIEMPDQITNLDTRDRYYISSLIQEAITSSQLEGAVTTREVAKEMIRTNRPPSNKHEQMILNNYQTMLWLGKVKSEELTPELIDKMHRKITRGTLEDSEDEGRPRGPERNIKVSDMYGVVCHEPPDADELPTRMRALCDFANGKTPESFVHPVIRSIVLHFWLAYDHYYVDGNGRTARALFYWSMLKHGYWLFEFVSLSQAILKAPKQYYKAFLYTETDENDLTYFLLNQLKAINQSIEMLNEYVSEKAREIQAVERFIRDATFNHRQRALLGHALRHPDQRYTTESHRTSHLVTFQTARTDLVDLEVRGLFTRTKIGRTDSFKPADGLADRLCNLGMQG